jgi:signal transduction histidine kinase
VFQSWTPLTTCLIVFVSAGGGAVAACIARRWRRYQDMRLNQVRRRIATDLHDDIGSSLSQVAIMCEVLSRRSANERESLQEIAGVSRNALTSMSEIVWAVDPTHDHLHDLTQRMRWFAGDTLCGRNVSLDFTALEPSWEVRLAADTRRQLFLIFKESVNNIVRHSGATHAKVLLRVLDDALLLTVEDDGRGFDASSITEGNGLRNIGCRATSLQGKVEIRSRVGQGTLIALRVPLMQAAQPWRRILVRSRRVAAA